MCNINDKIYIKKYMGDELCADTSKIYVINHIYKTKNYINNTIFEKHALLNNGKDQLIYTHDIITKKKIFYIEKIPFWYNNFFCCM
jgi:hypothetical protein